MRRHCLFLVSYNRPDDFPIRLPVHGKTMRIKSLKIYGFKSFPQRGHVEFNPGITAIVGPNGCGKTNILDAIRWILGGAKNQHYAWRAHGGCYL